MWLLKLRDEPSEVLGLNPDMGRLSKVVTVLSDISDRTKVIVYKLLHPLWCYWLSVWRSLTPASGFSASILENKIQ